MSASNVFETDILELIFNGTGIDNIADNTATSPATNLYVSLHTASPDEGGSQSSSEATYTSYARVAVARTSSGWTISGDTAENTAQIAFPACTGGTNVVTHFGIGTGASGLTDLLFYGELTNPLNVSNGIYPIYQAGELKITAD